MTNLALKDGLSSGETKANDLVADEMFSGAAPAHFGSVNTGSISATNIAATGSITCTKKFVLESAGSPYGEGAVYNFTCAGAITGGQLVFVSGGVGIAASAQSPVTGVAYGTAHYTSGTAAVIPVIVFGSAYVNACADIADGNYARTGSVAHMVESGTLGPQTLGKCIKSAASGTSSLAIVFVGKL